MLKFCAGATACFVGFCAFYAFASRNSSGTMAAINGPYTPGSVISSSVINARLADIENEITDSKSRSGKGDFSAPVRGANGTVAAPTWSFTSEPGSGLYRIGAGDLGFAVLGTKQLELTATEVKPYPGGNLAGTFNQYGFKSPTTLPLNLYAKGTFATIGFNLYYDGANTKYITSDDAGEIYFDTSGNMVFATAPSGTADANVTPTTRIKVTESGVSIGASGSALANVQVGSCNLNAGSPSTCTATVQSGAKCLATYISGGSTPITVISGVAATTATFTTGNGNTGSIGYLCWN